MESKVECETVENKLEIIDEESGADNLHMAKLIDSRQVDATLVDSGPLESVEIDSCVTINSVTASRPDDRKQVNRQIATIIFPKAECKWMNFCHNFGIILSFYWGTMLIVGNILRNDLPLPTRASWVLGATQIPWVSCGLRLTQPSKPKKFPTASFLLMYFHLSACSLVLVLQMINISCQFTSADKFDTYLCYHLPLLVSFLGLIPTMFSIENIMAGKLRYLRKLSMTNNVYNFGNFQKFRYMNICFITIGYWLLASAMTRVYAYEETGIHSTVMLFAGGGFIVFGDRALDVLLKCESRKMFGFFLYVQKQAVLDLITFCMTALLVSIVVICYDGTLDYPQSVSIVIDGATVGAALGVSVLTYFDCRKLILRLEQNRGEQYLLILRELYK